MDRSFFFYSFFFLKTKKNKIIVLKSNVLGSYVHLEKHQKKSQKVFL